MTDPERCGLSSNFIMWTIPRTAPRVPQWRTGRTGIALFALASILTAVAAPARAALCGDDVDGRDVPCACGDIVVSSVTLRDDPVVAAACPRDGLIVRLAAGLESAILDLNGHVLRGGAHGVGIRVLDGGRYGARIYGGGAAAIEGFRDAIVAQAGQGIASIQGLRVVRPRRDGIRVVGAYGDLTNVEVVGAGRDGIFVRGSAWLLTGVTARFNGRDGVSLMGYDHRAAGKPSPLRSHGNGRSGVRLWGHRHAIDRCDSSGNRGDGVYLNGYGFEVNDCLLAANHGAGLTGNASATRLGHNHARDNLRDGIVLHGHGLEDAGGNRADGNPDASECRLGLTECSR